MIKLTFLREEDFWLVPLSAVAVVFVAVCLYAGVMQLRLLSALIGFSCLWFTTYVVRKGYGKRHSQIHMLICLGVSILLAIAAFLLTN